MKAAEFLRKVKKYAASHQLAFRWEPWRGNGSHGTIFLGQAGRTTLKDLQHDVGPGLLNKMCKDLGVRPADLK